MSSSQFSDLISSFPSFLMSHPLPCVHPRPYAYQRLHALYKLSLNILFFNNSYLFNSSPIVVINSKFSLTPLGHRSILKWQNELNLLAVFSLKQLKFVGGITPLLTRLISDLWAQVSSGHSKLPVSAVRL